jgi:hypothetical protein
MKIHLAILTLFHMDRQTGKANKRLLQFLVANMLKKMQVQNICTALEYSLPLFFNLK